MMFEDGKHLVGVGSSSARTGRLTGLVNDLGERFGCTRKSKLQCKVFSKATISIYASILMWVGGWNLLSEYKKSTGENTFALFPATLLTDLCYLFIGAVLMMAADTFLGNGGVYPEGVRAFTAALPESWTASRLGHIMRLVLAIVGCFLFWVGCYNAIDRRSVQKSASRDACILIFGYLGLLWTDISAMSYIYYEPYEGEEHEDQEQASTDDDATAVVVISEDTTITQDATPLAEEEEEEVQLDTKATLILYFRAAASLGFQNMVWVGGYSLLELHYATTYWRELCYCLIGVIGMIMTNTFITSAWLPFEGWPWDQKLPRYWEGHQPLKASSSSSAITPFSFYFRATLTLASQVINNTGAWTLLDVYVFPTSAVRNVIYLVAGMLLLWSVDTFHLNFALALWTGEDEDIDQEQGEDPHKHIGNATKQVQETIATLQQPSVQAQSLNTDPEFVSDQSET